MSSLAVATPVATPRQRDFGFGLAGIVAGAAVLHGAYLIGAARSRELGWDASFYHAAANSLAAGNGYTIACPLIDSCTPRTTTVFPPLYSVSLATVSVLGLRSVLAHQLMTVAFGVAAVAVIGLLGRRVGGRRVGLLAAGIAALNPLWITLEGALMSESLTVLLTATLLLCVYRARDRSTILRWLVVGVLAGLSALTHGEGTAWLVLLAWPAVVTARDLTTSRRLVLVGVTTAAAVVVVAPWVARNQIEFGRPLFGQANASATLDGANCDRTYDAGPDQAWWVDCRTWTRDDGTIVSFADLEAAGVSEPDLYDHQFAEGAGYALGHRSQWVIVAPARVARAWNITHPFELQTGTIYMRKVVTPFGWLVLAGGIAGFIVLFRRRADWWPLGVTVAVVVVTIAMTYGNQRFRVAAEPALIVASAATVDAVVARLRRRGGQVSGVGSPDGTESHEPAGSLP